MHCYEKYTWRSNAKFPVTMFTGPPRRKYECVIKYNKLTNQKWTEVTSTSCFMYVLCIYRTIQKMLWMTVDTNWNP